MTSKSKIPRRGADAEHARRCEALIEHAFDVITIVDTDGTIVYSSPSTGVVLGWNPGDVVGHPMRDFVHDEDRALIKTETGRLVRERRRFVPMEIRVKHRNGEWLIVQMVAQNLLDDPDIRGVVLNYRDVTAQKRFEERYSTAFRCCPDSITISHLEDGRLVEVNDGFERLTGYRRDEVRGKTANDLGLWRHPPDRDRFMETLRIQQSVRNHEADFVIRTGEIRNSLVSAEIIELEDEPCVLMFVKDVTEIKYQNRRLRETSERLRRERREATRKNTALNEVLKHLEHDKAAYRHELNVSLDKLLRPLISKLESGDPALKPDEIDAVRAGLTRIIGQEIDDFRSNLSKLTPRELDIGDMIRKGLSTKEIAVELNLSPETIHKHRQAIRKKLQIDHSGVSLASYLRTRS